MLLFFTIILPKCFIIRNIEVQYKFLCSSHTVSNNKPDEGSNIRRADSEFPVLFIVKQRSIRDVNIQSLDSHPEDQIS